MILTDVRYLEFGHPRDDRAPGDACPRLAWQKKTIRCAASSGALEFRVSELEVRLRLASRQIARPATFSTFFSREEQQYMKVISKSPAKSVAAVTLAAAALTIAPNAHAEGSACAGVCASVAAAVSTAIQVGIQAGINAACARVPSAAGRASCSAIASSAAASVANAIGTEVESICEGAC